MARFVLNLAKLILPLSEFFDTVLYTTMTLAYFCQLAIRLGSCRSLVMIVYDDGLLWLLDDNCFSKWAILGGFYFAAFDLRLSRRVELNIVAGCYTWTVWTSICCLEIGRLSGHASHLGFIERIVIVVVYIVAVVDGEWKEWHQTNLQMRGCFLP